MDVCEMNQKAVAKLATKIVNATEEDREAVFRAYMDDLVESTRKWLKDNNYFMGE
jgi:hypothetical protein